MKHKKHSKLTRPDYGQFGRTEFSILGTPCGVIQQLAFELTKSLSQDWKLSYVDADHKSADEEAERDQKSAMAYGAKLEYTDKITFHRFDKKAKLDSFQFRQYFNEMDLVLVNGNHFKAKSQIVVIDPKKEESLKRKLDRLTDVSLILLQEGVSDVYPFLKEALANFDNIPVLKITQTEEISSFIHQKLQAAIPPLNGLVLAGGKSTRMGTDKGLLNYHGKPQRSYLFETLQETCEQTFISCRPEQASEIQKDFPILPDSFMGLGPFGAILSAFRKFPNHAWLVVACDLPLLDKKSLQFLIENRNASKIATAFHNPATDFPEPLITIWEPSAYPVLFQFLAQGYSCPRKVLINSEIEVLGIENSDVLMNVNKPEEMEAVRKLLVK